MLASMLLAAPLLALQTHTARADAHQAGKLAAEPRKASTVDHRRPERPRARQVARRRAPASTVAFLDDTGGWHQSGLASWYGGPRWQGQRTASGLRYEQDALTAAHATLPLGSRVRVSLAGTARSVVVVINDRPGTRARIIDLSRAAAAALGMLDRGVAQVTLSPP